MESWPPYEEELEKTLAEKGANMVADVLTDWLGGKINEEIQDHSHATVCKKIKKEDGKLNLNGDPERNLRLIRAYHKWPGTFFFQEHKGQKIRIKITRASLVDGQLVIEKVIPEGKKEMSYKDFLNGFR